MHGDDEVPAVSINVEIETANTLLDLIDPQIRQALYKAKPEETPELPGVDASTPVLRCNSIDRVKLTTAHEGWTLVSRAPSSPCSAQRTEGARPIRS